MAHHAADQWVEEFGNLRHPDPRMEEAFMEAKAMGRDPWVDEFQRHHRHPQMPPLDAAAVRQTNIVYYEYNYANDGIDGTSMARRTTSSCRSTRDGGRTKCCRSDGP